MRSNVSVERLKTDEAVILEKDQPVVCHAVSNCLMVLHMPDDGEIYSCYHFPGNVRSYGMQAHDALLKHPESRSWQKCLQYALRWFRRHTAMLRTKPGITYLIGNTAKSRILQFLSDEISSYHQRLAVLISTSDQFVDFVFDPAKKQIFQERYNIGNDDNWQPGDPCQLISTKVLYNFPSQRSDLVLSPTLWTDSDSDEDGEQELVHVSNEAQALVV